jgi:hypothetical protein
VEGRAVAFETTKISCELPDGGRVEVTDDKIVPMGAAYHYRQITYTTDTCEIVFEVDGGVPGCVTLKLQEGERPIRAKDLVAIKLDQIRDEAYACLGVIMPDPDGGYELTYQAGRKVIERATRRQKITPEFLRRVAEIHHAAAEGGRLAAVMAAFPVAERQALRYIAQAREKGLIND